MNKYPASLHKNSLVILFLILAFSVASCTHSVRGAGEGIPIASSRPVCLPRADFEQISLALKRCLRERADHKSAIRDAREEGRVILEADRRKCEARITAMQARRCACPAVWPWVVVAVIVGGGAGVVVGVMAKK